MSVCVCVIEQSLQPSNSTKPQLNPSNILPWTPQEFYLPSPISFDSMNNFQYPTDPSSTRQKASGGHFLVNCVAFVAVSRPLSDCRYSFTIVEGLASFILVRLLVCTSNKSMCSDSSNMQHIKNMQNKCQTMQILSHMQNSSSDNTCKIICNICAYASFRLSVFRHKQTIYSYMQNYSKICAEKCKRIFRDIQNICSI